MPPNPVARDPDKRDVMQEVLVGAVQPTGDAENVAETEDSADSFYVSTDEDSTGPESPVPEAGEHLFWPPLYRQRYHAVIACLDQEQIRLGNIQSILDVGCAECSFLKMLERRPGTRRLVGLDIDGDLLELKSRLLAPIVADHLDMRDESLEVEIYAGSIADLDSRLHGLDAVTAIEVIEHLEPEVLASFTQRVFGELAPKVVVITTPNAEYNCLFPSFVGPFRHWDHKFEWTREEFRCWVGSILEQYGDYEARITGVGHPPNGPSPLFGPCSQMAVFSRKLISQPRSSTALESAGIVYHTVATFKFPYFKDTRTLEEKIFVEADFYLRLLVRQIVRNNEEYYDADMVTIQISELLDFSWIRKLTSSCELVTEVLRNRGFSVEEGRVMMPVEDEDVEDDSSCAYSDSEKDDEYHGCLSEGCGKEPLAAPGNSEVEGGDESWD